MRKYTRREALKLFGIGTVAVAGIGLVGCSGSGANNGAVTGPSEAPSTSMSASQAFFQQNVWMQCSSSDIPEKDTTVQSILVFDGNGNVTRYETSYAGTNENTSYEAPTFGDLDGLSNDEIIELAKKKNRERFELLRQTSIDETNESLEFYQQDAGFYQDNIANATEGQKVNEAAEYEEPEAVPFTLAIETDGTGNNTETETIEFEAVSLNPGYFYAGSHIGSAPDQFKEELYKTETKSIELGITGGQIVYDTIFGGYTGLYTVVDSWDVNYMLDTPDTEGIEVD